MKTLQILFGFCCFVATNAENATDITVEDLVTTQDSFTTTVITTTAPLASTPLNHESVETTTAVNEVTSSPSTVAVLLASPQVYSGPAEDNSIKATVDDEVDTKPPDLLKDSVGVSPLLKNISAPCSKRLGTYMERTLKNFPARLPELWEFRRRRFLRAAVVGGLPQIVVERQDVTCNVSNAVTTWDVFFRSQLDGICNLGITGLPRMYLRFTGPLTAKARFTAPLTETSKPVLDDLQVVSADVHEIHYQSVLGFEQPFVERASKYLLQRALKEEVLGPLKEALVAEMENPTLPDKNKVLALDDKAELDM